MRVFPNYLYNTVHISQPYELEKWMFGLNFQGTIITPNEFFSATHSAFLDILTGVFYLNWVPLPLLFAFYFFATGKKELFYSFSVVFFLTNIIGFVIYYAYPAAPPWYYATHGNNFIADTMGSRAGFAHFDQLVGVDVFKNIYDKNANVFAAIPSLHSSYPVILLFYARKLKKTWITIALSIFTLGIWFSAVYSGHHYVIDVMLGLCCAIVGISMFTYLSKIPKIKQLLHKFSMLF
jgi:membrane-associated phospholipid phosphatase